MEKTEFPLIDHYFVPLQILSSSVSAAEIKTYETQMQEYHEILERNERMGFGKDPEQPTVPGENTEYKTVNLNLAAYTITSWVEAYDSQRNHPIVVVDVINLDGVSEQMNIKITAEEWQSLIESLGAFHYGG
jgi:hypothetical protein